MKQRLVVIGGVAAGMSAASRAKRVNPELDVIVLEKGAHISYGACSLPYFVAGNFDDYRTLVARTPEEAATQGIDVRTGHEARAIDLGEGVVHVGTEAGVTEQIPFDVLVLATGAEAIVPAAWGTDGVEGAFLLRNIEDAQAIRRWIGVPDVDTARGDQEGPAVRPWGSGKSPRAVVVGGGYIGVEAVDALLGHDIAVTLVDMAPQLLTNFDPDIAGYVQNDLRDAGVDIRLGDGVDRVQSAGGRVTGVRLASGEVIAADMVVMALGVRPNVALARAAGIEIGETGAIVVDAQQRTNISNVFAAGDCCETRDLVTGRPVYIPLGTTANKQGRVAGTVIGGGEASFAGVVGTAVVKARNMSVARTGLSERQARDLGYDVVAATITANDRADSYPGVQQVTVKLVGEQGTGRLLGAQVAGREPLAVAGRIDVVATALFSRMTVNDFGQLDLCYSPPFAPVWDALLVAANVLQRQL